LKRQRSRRNSIPSGRRPGDLALITAWRRELPHDRAKATADPIALRQRQSRERGDMFAVQGDRDFSGL